MACNLRDRVIEQIASSVKPSEVKKGVDFVFEQNPELVNIGTQEQYSQYLDTIFPDSKVKDIVYHVGAINKNDKFDRNKIGIYSNLDLFYFSAQETFSIIETKLDLFKHELKKDLFYKDKHLIQQAKTIDEVIQIFKETDSFKNSKQQKQKLSHLEFLLNNLDQLFYDRKGKIVGGWYSGVWNKGQLIPAILDIKNPYDGIKANVGRENLNTIEGKGPLSHFILDEEYDSKYNPKGPSDIGVRNPEQIHILGSKQDVEGFKKFIQGKPNDVKSGVEELFNKNETLANAVYEALGFINKQELEVLEKQFSSFSNIRDKFKGNLKDVKNLVDVFTQVAADVNFYKPFTTGISEQRKRDIISDKATSYIWEDNFDNYRKTIEKSLNDELESEKDRYNYWFDNGVDFYTLDVESGKYYKYKSNATVTPLEKQYEVTKKEYYEALDNYKDDLKEKNIQEQENVKENVLRQPFLEGRIVRLFDNHFVIVTNHIIREEGDSFINEIEFIYYDEFDYDRLKELEKQQITPEQKAVAQQLYSQYLDTKQNDVILPTDRIVFGHPTIGKSYLKQKGNNNFITLDDDYANEVNTFIDANRGSETRQEYKGRKPQEYNEFMLNLFDRLKVQAKKEGKKLFVSNTNILKERMSEFDKVITIPKDEFKKRFDARGATYGFEDWKSHIDTTISKVDKSKVISTTGYLSDLLEDSKQDIENFAKFVKNSELGNVRDMENYINSKSVDYIMDKLIQSDNIIYFETAEEGESVYEKIISEQSHLDNSLFVEGNSILIEPSEKLLQNTKKSIIDETIYEDTFISNDLFYNGKEYESKEDKIIAMKQDGSYYDKLPEFESMGKVNLILNMDTDSIYEDEFDPKEMESIEDLTPFLYPETLYLLNKSNATTVLSESNAFDKGTNTVHISPESVQIVSENLGISKIALLNAILQHELYHSLSTKALKDSKIQKQVRELLTIVKNQHKNNPFNDILRASYLNKNSGLPYALGFQSTENRDVEEFLADAFGNPYFKSYLQNIPYENKSIWDKFIGIIKNFFGIKSEKLDSIYNKLENIYTQKSFKEAQERLSNMSEDGIINFDAKNMTRNQILTHFVEVNGLEKIFTSKIKDFIDSIKEIQRTLPQKSKSVLTDSINSMLKVIDNEDETLSLGSMLSQMTSVRSIMTLIEQGTKEKADKADNDVDKIGIYTTGLKQMEAFNSYITFSSNVLTDIKDRDIDLVNDIKKFQENDSLNPGQTTHTQLLRLLEAIAGGRKNMLDTLNKLNKDPIYRFLNEQVSEETKTRLAIVNDEIARYEAMLQSPDHQSPKGQAFIKDRINFYQTKIKALIPDSPEWFKKELNGDYGALGTFNKYLEAAQVSKSPTIQIIAKLFKEANINADRASLEETNEAAKVQEALMSVIDVTQLTIDKVNDPILTLQTVVEEVDDLGNITKSFERDALLNIYTQEYKTTYDTLNLRYTTLGEELHDLKRTKESKEKNSERIAELEVLYLDAKTNYNNFLNEFTERVYTKEKYETDKILEEDIDESLPGITLKKERGILYSQIDHLYIEIANENSEEAKDLAIQELGLLQVRLKDLETLENKTPNSKEWFLAKKAIQYREARKKIGESLPDPVNTAFYEELLAFKEKQLANGTITQKDFDLWDQQNSRIIADQSWHDENKLLREAISRIWNQIKDIISSDTEDNIFKDMDFMKDTSNKEAAEVYEKLRNLTKPFRNNEGIIDGILIEEVDKKQGTNLVAEVKNLDMMIEEIRVWKDTLSGASKAEKFYKEASKDFQIQAFKDRARLGLDDLIDDLNDVFSEFGDINTKVTTEYYNRRKEDVINELKEDITDYELENAIIENNDLNSFNYTDGPITITYSNKRTTITITDSSKDEDPIVIKNQSYNDFQDNVKRKLAEKNLVNSEWFENNHYERIQYDEVTKKTVLEKVPIYIWNHTKPTDESLISRVPSFKYNTFKVKDEFKNPNYGIIPDGTPLPKQNTKYINKEFVRMSTSTDPKDVAYFNYLQKIRDIHYKAQKRISKNKRFGDATPAVVLSGDEKRVDFVKNLASPNNFIEYGKDIYRNLKGNDTQELNNELQGIVSKEYMEKQEIPLLFTGKLESVKQSKNVLGSVLMFSLSTIKRDELLKLQPIVTSVYNIASEGSRKTVTQIERNGIVNKILKTVKGNSSETDLKEVLGKLIESELYGSRVDNVGIEIFGIDLNKVLTSVMKMSAFSSFAGNIFSPIKNTVGGKIQSYIEQNKKYGKYSEINWATAEKEAFMYTNDLLSDYSKFGNQTLISQLMDYFQVMQGTRYDKLGHKTQWNKIKNVGELLTAPKDFSEFQLQLTQFLAYADATFIETKEGKIKLLKAFDLKNGNLIVKDIFTPEQKKAFDKKTIDFTFSLHHMNISLNGAYRLEEGSIFQRNIIGRAAFFMNKYLIPGLARRYAGNRFFMTENDVYSGFYISSIKFLFRDTWKFGFNFVERYNLLSDSEKHNLSKFVKEQAVISAIAILMMIIAGGDDDKELTEAQKLSLAYMMGISMEAQTFSIVSGTDEMLRKIKNPFVFARTLGQVRNATAYSLLSIIGSDDAYYKRDSGINEKGDSKVMANLYKLLSLSPSNIATFDIEALYRQQKSFYNGGGK